MGGRRGAASEITIGLLWHSANSGNLGIGALTIGNIAMAEAAARDAGLKPRFLIMGFVDGGVQPYVAGDNIELVPLNARALVPGGTYWKALRRTDVLLDIGGGDSFADIYGRKRFAYLWLTKMMGVARGVPLLLSPQTIGPFNRQPETFLAAWAMRQAEAVIARDPLSAKVARQMAPKAHVIESVDVAFALPFDQRATTPEAVDVGVNVSGLLFNGGYSGSNEFGIEVDYAGYTRALISELTGRAGVRVHLVSHVNSQDMPQDDDGRVADRLAREFPGVIRAPTFASPSEAKSYISGLDFLVAGRMHACIAAYSSGVPVVPVAYSRKFAGLFEGVLGYPHIVPVSGLSTDEAVKFTLSRLDDREALRAEIVEGSKRIEARLGLYRAELRRLFEEVARAT